jgi:hypothetical protein
MGPVAVTKKSKHWAKVVLVAAAVVAGWEWTKGKTKVGKKISAKSAGSVY